MNTIFLLTITSAVLLTGCAADIPYRTHLNEPVQVVAQLTEQDWADAQARLYSHKRQPPALPILNYDVNSGVY